MSTWQPIDVDPPRASIERLVVVPFLPDGACALIRRDDRLELPAGVLGADEDVRLGGALRIVLETAGFRTQRLHAFACSGADVALWADGDVYRGKRPHATVDLNVADPGELAATLRSRGDDETAQLVEMAASSRAATTDPLVLRAEHLAMLEQIYLAAETAQGGSGYGGSPEEWRINREPIVDGIHHDGSFLDLGCANGLLMESVRPWALEQGFDIEPYGVDVSVRLVERARERVPRWADRIWQGDASSWVPADGMRFDFLHSSTHELAARADVLRLLTFVRPGGRLLYSRYIASDAHDRTAAQSLRALGFDVAGECRPAADGRCAPPSTAWIEVPR